MNHDNSNVQTVIEKQHEFVWIVLVQTHLRKNERQTISR